MTDYSKYNWVEDVSAFSAVRGNAIEQGIFNAQSAADSAASAASAAQSAATNAQADADTANARPLGSTAVQWLGNSLAQRGTIDFEGAGVSVADDAPGGRTKVTIAGSTYYRQQSTADFTLPLGTTTLTSVTSAGITGFTANPGEVWMMTVYLLATTPSGHGITVYLKRPTGSTVFGVWQGPPVRTVDVTTVPPTLASLSALVSSTDDPIIQRSSNPTTGAAMGSLPLFPPSYLLTACLTVASTSGLVIPAVAQTNATYKTVSVTLTNGQPSFASSAGFLSTDGGATVSGAGIPAGTTVSYNSTSSMTMSANATASGTVPVTFAKIATVQAGSWMLATRAA